MPLNILRLNWRHQPPNDRIIFIKALPGPSSSLSESYLSRVAAICLPITRAHHLSVTSLEEFPPNREFAGRNFNAGECIQLVLKSFSGAWLPFRHVQMVMMHELAHNVQMNHGKDFWETRDLFVGELRALWERGYTGDGVWGVGNRLGSGGLGEEFEGERVVDGWGEGEDGPKDLCGGAYRSRKGKRKRKPELTYQERKERRIEKKFGKNGTSLGGDVGTRVELEKGKVVKGQPRVAGSARGRELRAAAALARFDQQKKDEDEESVKNEEGATETESDYEDEDIKMEEAVDIDGSKLQDRKGNGMIRVCEGEDGQDVHVKREMEEIQGIDEAVFRIKDEEDTSSTTSGTRSDTIDASGSNTYFTAIDTPHFPSSVLAVPPRLLDDTTEDTTRLVPSHPSRANSHGSEMSCPVCTTANDPEAPTCIACANVLNLDLVSDHWHCSSEACKDSDYVNAGDCGLCGICGAKKNEVLNV
jgi:DNA-dependent metalloprotease WSS1